MPSQPFCQSARRSEAKKPPASGLCRPPPGEQELFERLYALVRDTGKTHSRRGLQLGDAQILLCYLWAVLHDRPTAWACQSRHWPAAQPWGDLPSPSTRSRRLRRVGVLSRMEQVLNRLREAFPHSLLKMIDDKPLPVSAVTKDRDARAKGYAAGVMARGYKLHAVLDARQAVDGWRLAPMNRQSCVIAPDLIASLEPCCYLLGDNSYDREHLYQQAGGRGTQLLAPRKPTHQHLPIPPQASPWRQRSLQLAQGLFGQELLEQRDDIDRFFGHLSSFGAGLSPLPSWVRTPHRVRLWVAGKLAIYGLRLALRKGLTP